MDACRSIVADWAAGKRADIDEETIGRYLYTSGQPDPDLMIRTSGELRVSNFLLWQIAYAEIWVTQTLWPDFRRRDLYEAILDYQRRERRFGGVGAARGGGRLRLGPALGRHPSYDPTAMKRLLTAAIGVPLVLAAVFLTHNWWWFAIMAVVIELAVYEYVEICRPQAPRAPLRLLLVLAPAAAFALSYALSAGTGAGTLRLHLLGGALLLSVGLGTLILLSRTPLEEALPALGDLRLRHPLLRRLPLQPPPDPGDRSLADHPAAGHRLAGGHRRLLRRVARSAATSWRR